MRPELGLRRLPQACLLTPVCKNGRQLSSASLLERVFRDIVVVTEGWELGNGPEEVIILVDIVGVGESNRPLRGWEDFLDQLHVLHVLINVDWAIKTKWSLQVVLH